MTEGGGGRALCRGGKNKGIINGMMLVISENVKNRSSHIEGRCLFFAVISEVNNDFYVYSRCNY